MTPLVYSWVVICLALLLAPFAAIRAAFHPPATPAAVRNVALALTLAYAIARPLEAPRHDQNR